jgi:hypothetical protein
MKSVLTLSVFEGAIIGHGGEKRTQQIKDVISSSFQHNHLVFPINYHSQERISLRNKLVHSICVPNARLASRTLKENYSLNKNLIESHKFYAQNESLLINDKLFEQATTVIWENNYHDFFYFPYIIKKRYGKKIIACPQNIESLVPRVMTGWLGKTKLDYLKQELEPFRMCDEVFTIAEEDQWLFNLLDIKAKFLPSFPARELQVRNLEQRRARESKSQEDFFLVIGTVGNPPTLSGMTRLLLELQSINVTNFYHFKVAGFGTEIFRSQFGAVKGMEILGSLEQSDLDILMEKCRAIIINQDYCPGALTKVPEILISGIPVIMNTGASRSYKRLDGVYVYESIVELERYLNSPLPIPNTPSIPFDNYKNFTDAIV